MLPLPGLRLLGEQARAFHMLHGWVSSEQRQSKEGPGTHSFISSHILCMKRDLLSHQLMEKSCRCREALCCPWASPDRRQWLRGHLPHLLRMPRHSSQGEVPRALWTPRVTRRTVAKTDRPRTWEWDRMPITETSGRWPCLK